MSIESFVRRVIPQMRQSINRSYKDIDMLYYELDFLNDLLTRYLNRRSGNTLTHSERRKEIDDIRERISNIYRDINYYKECINVEKSEIKRIYETYGSKVNVIRYDKEYITDYELYSDADEEFEEIKEYKYNYATGVFE